MLTLTPNRRLSATLQQLYSQQQLEAGNQSWPTPQILPLNSWLQKLWLYHCLQSFDDEPYLLSPEQEIYIWEKIIVRTKESEQLLQIHQTAELVRSAYVLLKQWRIDWNQPIFQSAEDYAALVRWIKEYQSICTVNNWIDAASLPEALHATRLPEKIKLNGFTELSPQIKYFLRNVQLENVACEQDCLKSQRLALETAEDELLTMARWAYATHLQNKTARIACVIPDLATTRDRVEQIFKDIFTNEDAFNISAGKPLVQYAIIDTALQLLNLFKKKTSSIVFSYLLTSPFVGNAESERGKRSTYDVFLRKENISQIDLDRLLPNSLTRFTPKLAERLNKYFVRLAELPETQSFQAWSYTFNELLSILGWPGERSLSSVEYQIVESWLELLQRFATLDQVTQPVNMQEALSVLQRMAGKAVFQPKTPPAPVQILGVLEAAGIPFDYVWIAGMNDIAWPPAPAPNPFIPKSLQREQNMPHATAEREHLFCNSILEQFKTCSRQIIFSHAKHINDLEFKISPLIHVEHELNLSELSLPIYISPIQHVFSSKKLSTVLDDTAPPVIEDKVMGGVSILKLQAACPFRAFAQWRLHAHELESPSPGLRARDRGNVIHKALEVIWGKLGDYQQLNQLADSDLQQVIETSINIAMSAFPESHINLTQYLSLEKIRLQKILRDWLEIEKTRPPFKVLQNEAKLEYKLQKLEINVRVDRIDELADGKKLIIDYKTGDASVTSWFDHRLDEPQLPLYALLDPANTIGICFAQVSAGKHNFKGVSQYDLEIKGIKEVSSNKMAAASWPQQISAWQDSLAKIADDFCNGKAKVDPKDPDQTCTHCALEPLCRKNEEIVSL